MRRSRKGSALIEFAASLIVLSTVFTGIFQFGYTFYAYNTLVNAVRAGARYASLQPQEPTAANPDFAKTVRNLVVYGEPAPAADAKPVVAGLTTNNVVLTFGPSNLTVAVQNFEIDSMFSKLKLDGRPVVTFPYTGGASR